MKTTIALILLIGGTLIMVGGFAWAVWELAAFYRANLDDGLNNTADAKQTSTAMLTAAGVGLVGFIPATIGSIMIGKGLLGLIKKRLQGSASG